MHKFRFPSALRALNSRNYRLFFSGQFVSLTGTWMQSVAQGWLVYRLTGSAAFLGITAFCSQFPVFIMAPLGGAAADRYPRRRILVATQGASMLQALVFAVLVLSGSIEVWHVFCLAALLGVVNAFDIPARQSFVVEMAAKGDLINTIALNSSLFNSTRVVGPAAAGLVVAAVGEGWCFLANGLSYLAVIAGLLLMTLPPATRTGRHPSAISSIVEGFSFVAKKGPIRALLVMVGVASLTAMPYTVLMPVFAREVLGGGARELGFLVGASGIGALAGALVLAAKRTVRGLGAWVAGSAGLFGISLVLFSFSRGFGLSAALLVPTGFFMVVMMASSNTLIQSLIPDDLRGRAMALYSMTFLGMAPLGGLLYGTLAHTLGAPATVALGGVSCLFGAGVFASRLGDFHQEADRIIVALEEAAGDPAQEMTGRKIF